MALTYQAAVEQTITAGEQIHQIVNGTATTEVTVEDGSKVPSVRKALLDNFYFKDPIAWQVGKTESVFNQLRKFTDGSWWYAPSATASNPISMGATPVGNNNWKVYSLDAVVKLTPQLREALRRSYAEAGYNLVDGSFEAGGTVSAATDVLLYAYQGKAYSWGGALPKTVVVDSNPSSSGGIADGAWRPVGDITLREELAATGGVNLIGGAAKQSDLVVVSSDLDVAEADIQSLKSSVNNINDDLILSQTAVNLANANINVYGRYYARNNIVEIGDSISAGFGATHKKNSFISLVAQSISNYFKDGCGYPLIRNAGPADYIISHNGTASNAGLPADSITVSGPSQWVGIKPSEGIGIVAYVEVAAGTATTIQLMVNGSVVASASLSGTVYEALLTIPRGFSWTSVDDVRVTSPSGTLVLSGVSVLKAGNSVVNGNNTSPLMITCGHSGESFEFYRTNKVATAAMASAFGASGTSTYLIALGTNSIYNVTMAQTPSQYVTSMLGLESDLKAINPNINVIFTIPPQANETIFPVVKPGFTYKDYVDAIKAAVPDSKLIDLNIPNLPYVDGVHPSDVGHIAIARKICESLGIPFNNEPPELLKTVRLAGASPVVIDEGYASVDRHGRKTLYGKITPNGAGTNLLTTVEDDYRPTIDKYLIIPVLGASNGFGIIQIQSGNGEVRLIHSSVTWTSAYLDGVSYI